MHSRELLILTHEDGRFATKFVGELQKHEGVNLAAEELKRLFERKGFKCAVSTFSGLDKTRDYSGTCVLYASSEDPGKFYKGFIEDVILSLESAGAIAIPSYEYLHAHANKVYQELKRARFADEALRLPSSRVFGSFGEVQSSADDITYPCVIKTSAGSGSSGVLLAHNREELLACCKRLMRIRYIDYSCPLTVRMKLYVWRIIKKIIRHKHKQPVSENLYTNKIIVQDFISGLEGDFKVLYFYGRYYVLHRENRANDFRASGSGLFEFPENLDEIRGVLDLAKRATEELRQPMVSMDIVTTAKEGCRLIEYQCVYFGPLTMQYSYYYYTFSDDWHRCRNTCTLEEEYCRAICDYLSDLDAT